MGKLAASLKEFLSGWLSRRGPEKVPTGGHPLPERIDVTVRVDGNPCEGVCLKAKHNVCRRNDFTAPFGPTDRDGHACLIKEEIVRSAREDVHTAQMDYGSIIDDYVGTSELWIPGEPELAAALEGYELWRRFIRFPPGYKEMIERAIVAIQEHKGGEFTLEASAVPDSICLIVHPAGQGPYADWFRERAKKRKR